MWRCANNSSQFLARTCGSKRSYDRFDKVILVRFIDETVSDLKQLMEEDFGSLGSPARFDDTLLDWLHYRARSIPQRPREVIFSAETIAARAEHTRINDVAQALRNGWDMSPHLSDRIRSHKNVPNADSLFNDWQISHFHFGLFNEPNRVWRWRGRDVLLFAYVDAIRAVLLTVGRHGYWTRQEMLRILLHTYPPALERRELLGMHGSRTALTDANLATLRKNGISALIEIDGRTFTLDIAASGHADRIVLCFARFRKTVATILEQLKMETLPANAKRELLLPLGVLPRIGIRYEPAGFLVVYDKARNLDLYREGPLE
jgi:hypothetical protein